MHDIPGVISVMETNKAEERGGSGGLGGLKMSEWHLSRDLRQ